jgi:hypothetical protein
MAKEFKETKKMKEYDFLSDFRYRGINKQFMIKQDIENMLKLNLIKIGKGCKVIWNYKDCSLYYYEEFKKLCEENLLFWDGQYLYVIDPTNEYRHVIPDYEM